MKYTAATKPGMSDPYWYEWSVGQQYIIEMLNEESRIKYVELQANVGLGLDDVVVTFENDEKLFIQVKHTRADDNLTFGDLVTVDKTPKDKDGRVSLLGELAKSWNAEKSNYQQTRVCLFTNRKAGSRMSSTRTAESIKRPALKGFLSDLQKKLAEAKSLDDISFPEFEKAWSEWKEQLSWIDKDEDKLTFLKCLEIDTNNASLDELELELLEKIKTIFATNDANAKTLFMKLDHALRSWTTSTRKSSRITAEDVYKALSIDSYPSLYNHDLIPSEPFFESRNDLVRFLEAELKAESPKVIFLSGIPGTGKTNIISKLSAKRDSVIDIRYYAYEPIDPAREYLPMDVSKRVDKEYFWNELFNQLRKCLKPYLYKYRVPVINELMSLEEMKRRFFEIASSYASDHNRNFVIAVDGIDHAARAGHINQTFLPTLPDPEYIPSNVKILLAGQPKEDYSDYPAWLFSERDDVKEIKVPCIQENDVLSLVKAKFPGMHGENQIQMSKLIAKYAEGNTLAAIFAVHEALQRPNIHELEKQFQHRKLSGNIQEYYRTIWNDATSKIKISFVDYKIAGVFAFFNEAINENKLRNIYSEEYISVSDWRNILKTLRPLLTETDGQYAILHNDVRVFLSGIIGRDGEHVREVYTALSDYYINSKEKSQAYYNDIFRFLKGAGRISEFQKIYSPDYVIEAYVNGVELSDLHEISVDILEGILLTTPIEWTQMRDLSFGFMTIDQLEKSSYEIDKECFRMVNPYVPIHPYECYADSDTVWDSGLILDVLQHVKTLYTRGHKDRASQLFKRWFSGITIADMFSRAIISDSDDDHPSPELQSIASLFGECVCLFDEFSILEGIGELESKYRAFVHYLCEAAASTIITHLRGSALADAFDKLEILYIEPLMTNIKSLIEDNRYSDIKCLADTLHDRLIRSPWGTMFITFMEIISSCPDWTVEEKATLWQKIDTVEISGISFENEVICFSIYAIVAAYLRPIPFGECAKEILERYMAGHSHHSRSYFTVFFNSICLIGKWLSLPYPDQQSIISTGELKHLMNALFIKEWTPNDRGFDTIKLHPYLLKAYIMLSKRVSPADRLAIDEICEAVFVDYPVYLLLDAGIFYYRDDEEKLRLWYSEWLGEDGLVWNESLGERNRIIRNFERVTDKYALGKIIDLSAVIERARWSVIGYASHKEYSCDYLLDWYNSLTERDIRYVAEYAGAVKMISDQIEEIGDNRLSYNLNHKIYADIFDFGYPLIKAVMKKNHYLAEGFSSPCYFVDGLIGYLRHGEKREKALLEIWAMGTALLDFRDESDHATIHSLQRAVELCAERSGIESIYDRLKELSPAYIDLVSDPPPDRQCDAAGDAGPVETPKEIISAYLAGTDKDVSSYHLRIAVEALRAKREISDDELASLLRHSLAAQAYGISRNEFIQHLVTTMPASFSDPLIAGYLHRVIHEESAHLETDLPAFVLWKMQQQDEEYCKSGIDELIKMHKSWMTSAGHFPEPALRDEYDYVRLIDWDSADDLEGLFYQIIKLVIMSENADAVRVALSGLFTLLRVNDSLVAYLERDWDQFHYHAREWLVMIYELLWYLAPESREKIMHCVNAHCADENFNVALYSNIFLENLLRDPSYKYQKRPQPYFDSVPANGSQKFLKLPKDGPWVNGQRYVTRAVELMETVFGDDLSDIEKRTYAYAQKIEGISLIPLNRRLVYGGCRVVVDTVNIAFLRVMYKDWVNGRWDGVESELARIVLSSSEPYATLYTPAKWQHNGGAILLDLDRFVKQDPNVKREKIQEVLETGLADDEEVVAGSIVEYTHNQEIQGFCLRYLGYPLMPASVAINAHERNSRLLLQSRDDFEEYRHYNISIHYSGTESFQQSSIFCGLSKTALNCFSWQVVLSPEGLTLADNSGQTIGRFEFYYGNRAMGNRYSGNQPQLQRWIIKKDALANAEKMCRGGMSIKMVADTIMIDL